MAFTVQTDNGVTAGANAYLSVAEFDSYHGDRGNDVSGLSSTDKEQAIVKATDYLDLRYVFVGDRLNLGQSTEWPRIDAVDSSYHTRTGIPDEVKEATAEVALLSANGTDLTPVPTYDSFGQQVQSRRQKVGPIEREFVYVAGGQFQMRRVPVADGRLIRAGLVRGGLQVRRA